jgi:redox-sensitive bicupin YhaK (pirin superfamily)
MLNVRKSDERGYANHGWLNTYHSFSFANYYDPQFMGFRTLRVINDDTISPGRGFGTHGHQDMEIITYVLSGALQHQDSMGNTEVIRPQEVQRMSAGTGVKHSEFNASATEPVHLLQIWLLPDTLNLEPGYEQKSFPIKSNSGCLHLVGDRLGTDGAVTIHQDVRLYAGFLQKGEEVICDLAPERHGWLQVATGEINLQTDRETIVLSAGDGVAISAESKLQLSSQSQGEILLFDLA